MSTSNEAAIRAALSDILQCFRNGATPHRDIVEAAERALSASVPEHRYNYEQRDDGRYVCYGNHHRSEDCEWVKVDSTTIPEQSPRCSADNGLGMQCEREAGHDGRHMVSLTYTQQSPRVCGRCGHNNLAYGVCQEEVDMSSLTAMQMVELHQEFWDGPILRCGCQCEFPASVPDHIPSRSLLQNQAENIVFEYATVDGDLNALVKRITDALEIAHRASVPDGGVEALPDTAAVSTMSADVLQAAQEWVDEMRRRHGITLPKSYWLPRVRDYAYGYNNALQASKGLPPCYPQIFILEDESLTPASVKEK